MSDNSIVTAAERDALWREPVHWRRGSYRCAADPRLFVPNRAGAGLTVNMGHRRAQVLLWGFLGVVIALVALLAVSVVHAG